MEGGSDFGRLPEECISQILSRTTPGDACRLSLTSTAFQSAAESNIVWERFLPPDYEQILSRAVEPVRFSSKKELYFRLCNSILIDHGRKSFALEKSKGGKCYMLSARELAIIWSDDIRYYAWGSLPESRFEEVIELKSVCWLWIGGNINSCNLSPQTSYGAYIIFKLTPHAKGLDTVPQRANVRMGAQISERSVFLQPDDGEEEEMLRDDGWMEIELGEFYNEGDDDGEWHINLAEIHQLHWKSGIILEGIEIRPKNDM